MGLLPDDPRSQKSLLSIIAAIALGAVFYLYVYSPKSESLQEEEARLEQLEFLNQQANARIGNLDALRDELRGTEDQLEVLERLVPSQSEMPAIYQSIASEAEVLGLKLISVTPAAPVADTAGYFMRQDWMMSLEGEYHRIGEFITHVASFDRIVRPQIVDITPAGRTPSGRQLVNAVLSLETFVLQQPGQGDPDAEDG